MRSNKYIFFGLVFILCSIRSYSCSCDDLGGFAYSSQYTDVIGVFEFLENDSIGIYGNPRLPYSKKIRLIKQLRGRLVEDTVIVYGDYGADCSPYIGQFKNGETWLLALNKIDSGNEYELSSCGTFFLPITDTVISGNIVGKPYASTKDTMNLTNVTSVINSPEKYPIDDYQNKIKELGLYINCDCEPICPMVSQILIWNDLREFIKIPNYYMRKGDSFIIHLKILIYDDYHFLSFHGIEQNQYGADPVLDILENQINNWLNTLNCYKKGSANYYDVRSEVLLPVIIKK